MMNVMVIYLSHEGTWLHTAQMEDTVWTTRTQDSLRSEGWDTETLLNWWMTVIPCQVTPHTDETLTTHKLLGGCLSGGDSHQLDSMSRLSYILHTLLKQCRELLINSTSFKYVTEQVRKMSRILLTSPCHKQHHVITGFRHNQSHIFLTRIQAAEWLELDSTNQHSPQWRNRPYPIIPKEADNCDESFDIRNCSWHTPETTKCYLCRHCVPL